MALAALWCEFRARRIHAPFFTGLDYTIPGYLSVAISVWVSVVASVLGSDVPAWVAANPPAISSKIAVDRPGLGPRFRRVVFSDRLVLAFLSASCSCASSDCVVNFWAREIHQSFD